MTIIRQLTHADLATVLDLRLRWLAREFDIARSTEDIRAWFAAYPGNAQAFALVAIEDERSVGYILVSWHWHPTMRGRAAEIDEIHVAADYRRQGIGRKLIEHARELLLSRVEDLTTMRAFVDREDQIGNAFWNSIGFEHHVVEFTDYLESAVKAR